MERPQLRELAHHDEYERHLRHAGTQAWDDLRRGMERNVKRLRESMEELQA